LTEKKKIEGIKLFPLEEWKKIRFLSAQEVLNNGGTKIDDRN
jgi:hydroxymethylbilane synthase